METPEAHTPVVPPRPTVFVLDDDPHVLTATRLLIESMHLPAETFQSAEAFLLFYSEERCGCLVLDLRMPGMDGMELLEVLSKNVDCMPIIVATSHADVLVAVRAMRLGAVDFVQKPYTPQVMIEAIRRALQKDTERHARRLKKLELKQKLARLSDREREIMDLLVDCKTTKEIANILDISTKTVEGHRIHILAKLEVESVPELLRLVITMPSPPS